MAVAALSRQTLWPALALAATLGAALALAEGPGKRPAADLHRDVLAYHRALFEGETAAALSWVVRGSPAEGDGVARRVGERRGRPWLVRSLQTTPEGRGTVEVALYLDQRGSAAVIEKEEWRLAPDGKWRLFDLQAQREQPMLRPRRR
jgi:hypothetical protein